MLLIKKGQKKEEKEMLTLAIGSDTCSVRNVLNSRHWRKQLAIWVDVPIPWLSPLVVPTRTITRPCHHLHPPLVFPSSNLQMPNANFSMTMMGAWSAVVFSYSTVPPTAPMTFRTPLRIRLWPKHLSTTSNNVLENPSPLSWPTMKSTPARLPLHSLLL